MPQKTKVILYSVHVYRLIARFIRENPFIVGCLIIYIFLELSVLSWGVPNARHPFLYHMDEWHQLGAVRELFRQGTSNVPGAANGPIFHFFLSGIFAAPFILFGIIHPFNIQHSIERLQDQQVLFEVMRLNTLLWGIGSVIVLTLLVKRLLKSDPKTSIFLFIFTPIFLTLSNYFKYDLDLLFWEVLTLFFFIRYAEKPEPKNFYIAGVSIAIAMAVKISAIPLIPLYILSYGMFTKKRDKGVFIRGLFLVVGIFICIGIPDLIRSWHNYAEFFYSNLISNPKETYNYMLGMPYILYLFINQLPTNFGHLTTFLFYLASMYWFWVLFVKKKKMKQLPILQFLFISGVLFFVSLYPLKLFSSGNRSLVLLPFISLFTGLFVLEIFKFTSMFRKGMILIVIAFVSVQLVENYAWMEMKWSPDPRDTSSQWISTNIPPASEIGVENIPIYQMLPDVLLYDFYKEQAKRNDFSYVVRVIDQKSTNTWPKYIILTNTEVTKYMYTSPKKILLKTLAEQGYRRVASFSPNLSTYHYFGDTLSFAIPLLVPSPTDVSVFVRDVYAYK